MGSSVEEEDEEEDEEEIEGGEIVAAIGTEGVSEGTAAAAAVHRLRENFDYEDLESIPAR